MQQTQQNQTQKQETLNVMKLVQMASREALRRPDGYSLVLLERRLRATIAGNPQTMCYRI